MKEDCLNWLRFGRKVEIGMVGIAGREWRLAPSGVAGRLAGIAVRESRVVSLRGLMGGAMELLLSWRIAKEVQS